jgi:hypothetical protein
MPTLPHTTCLYTRTHGSTCVVTLCLDPLLLIGEPLLRREPVGVVFGEGASLNSNGLFEERDSLFDLALSFVGYYEYLLRRRLPRRPNPDLQWRQPHLPLWHVRHPAHREPLAARPRDGLPGRGVLDRDPHSARAERRVRVPGERHDH